MVTKCPSKTGYFKIDNLFSELLTEAQKHIARENLGIPEENFLYFKNIKGFPEDNTELMDSLRDLINEILSVLLNDSPEIFETVQQVSDFIKSNPEALQAIVSLQNSPEILEALAQFRSDPETLQTIKQVFEFFDKNPGDIQTLINQVNSNTERLNKTVYISLDEWNRLLKNNLIHSDVEYNIFEEK